MHASNVNISYSGPDRCVFVCLRSYPQKYVSDLHHFLCMLPMTVAQSSSGGVVIPYVFPVLWMTSYLHIS